MGLKIQICLQKSDFQLVVDTTLPTDEIVAICGPSGSGKTSVLRVLAGLEPTVSGNIIFQDHCWLSAQQFVPPHQRAVGLVFQEPGLFAHLNVSGNILYGRKRSKNSAQAIDLDHLLNLLGIRHLLTRQVNTLSGGERQRVAIARALAINPHLLLLDEPMSGLDAAKKHELIPYLKDLQHSLAIPIIYVSHDHHEIAQLADHLLLLENGQVKAQGSIQELATRLSLPLAHQPDAEVMVNAVVDGYDPVYQLLRLTIDDIKLWVPGRQRAIGEAVKVQILAKDVSICLDRPRQTSILNILETQIDSLMDEGNGQMLIKLCLPSSAILARITRQSSERLALKAGQKVYAQIKSVALL
ncbi:molybdenum ABC transporter ATP-binding protein [Aliiglaciecola sp. CAU 1673]|uniref:molybdenum ABC transporter ATP-binding protein n=1 Tax=Aliiglaciecola sp. CAU 1673 TaxID=3032595 RepID=UPI0023D9A835|nr:molybdenum ABC transporter ATP-binding protein [Aliiglaciecola sp. CAU 1673]MDF2177016.1 molybdenum ABC transporter ATP-binding protein [Aliiglaciecola sp. CAU 1673]